jgi:hypothetical protein
MELILKRTIPTDQTTIGELYIDGQFFCHTLEDVDRDLDIIDPLPILTSRKVYGQTAIPSGRYEIAITYSNKFKSFLPLLLNVPAYSGVRIHPGNKAADTLGCILVGQYDTATPNFIKNSRVTFNKLFSAIKNASKREKIFITIVRQEAS